MYKLSDKAHKTNRKFDSNLLTTKYELIVEKTD